MNLPNALTILRIFFVPLLVASLVKQDCSCLARRGPGHQGISRPGHLSGGGWYGSG